ncbi:Transcriptional regulator, TetR family OS=Tsukamurella paurometabola (strain ATCC 8368 / DSM/ CCUG 35730 / CIP 100753 / JCM 10117 / KCTC 9821 / NBRC 16120/ NCIMB 702349 / NCTC 13040) OX=521096 GN=Tpau_0359 PE=4 SV=1 [Tsukamurella paurometabola]|uniref:Transcriptional regulator, TetR family n=2 Tax=Tsukamurella paurometabola TaxID=2061 RepID=D5URE9_TSUPD|nr:transcriptional regulator, TetR family [Tsukamurella paurometabola DSM 20162]SUP42407.1 HTH-type transcriptional repressor fabR [Tsukamurella paurometabola]
MTSATAVSAHTDTLKPMPRPSTRAVERHTPGPTRAEAKERTRQALLDEALALAGERAFASLSLREVAKAAGVVPTAFYRHFASMDDLGVTLVEDAMRVLRRMLREGRRDGRPSGEEAVRVVAKQARANDAEFQFLVRERYGGSPELQRAIDVELRLFAKDLTHDLSRIPALADWSVEDLDMIADLYVTIILGFVAELVRIDPRNTRDENELIDRTKRQLTVVALGLGSYRPRE